MEAETADTEIRLFLYPGFAQERNKTLYFFVLMKKIAGFSFRVVLA